MIGQVTLEADSATMYKLDVILAQVQAMKEALSLTWSLSPGGARSFLGGGLETAAAPLTGTSPLQWHAHCMTGTLLISVRTLRLILTVLLGCVTIMNM